MCFDSSAKELYCADFDDGSGTRIYKWDQNLTTRNLVYTLPSGYKFPNSGVSLTVHGSNGRLYYSARNDSSNNKVVELHRVDLSSMADTQILTQSDGVTAGPRILWITTSKTEEYVFYTLILGTGATLRREVRRCDSDGSNDILIWDGQAAGGFTPFTVGVDDTGKFLYWDEANLRIHRSLLDGSGETTILDRDASIPPLPNTTPKPVVRLVGWSQKKLKLYFAAFVATTLDPLELNSGLGIWSMNNDGTDLEPEIVSPNVLTTLNLIDWTFHDDVNFVLGSGYAQE